MINFLLKFSIGTFLVLLIYDITNFIVGKTGTNSNPVMAVERDLSVHRKIDATSIEMACSEFGQLPLWQAAIGAGAAGGALCLCLAVALRGRKAPSAGQLAKMRKQSENEKPTHIVIIKEVGEGIYSDKIVSLSDHPKLSSSKISDISSLYEDVLSQNLIDLLFVKSPIMEPSDLLPVKLSTCHQKEDLTLEDPMETSNTQSSKTSLMGETITLDAADEQIAQSEKYQDVVSLKKNEQASVQCDGPERVSVQCGGSDHMLFLLEGVSRDPMSAGDTLGIMEKLEEKQKELEERLISMEDISHDWLQRIVILEKSVDKWSQRLDLAESELVDLHQQMYTVLTKLEEKPKQNYIVLSSLKKEATMLEQDAMKGIFDVETTLTKYITQDYVISENGRNFTKISQELVKPKEDRKFLESYGESEVEKVFHSKCRSIGLEAILEKEPQIRNKSSPKKTSCKVPLHVVPPYKRSSFTATDPLADVRKTAQRLKKVTEERIR